MKNNTLEVVEVKNTKTQQQLKLVDGKFTKSEALDIVNSVVDVKVNFHKLQRLSINEGDIKDKCTYDNTRILELIKDKAAVKEFLSALSGNATNIKITSTMHISIEN
jgi:uncharacterized protein with FMN-binding domain